MYLSHPSSLPANVLHAFLMSSIHCHSHPQFDHANNIWCRTQLWSFSLCSILHSPVTSVSKVQKCSTPPMMRNKVCIHWISNIILLYLFFTFSLIYTGKQQTLHCSVIYFLGIELVLVLCVISCSMSGCWVISPLTSQWSANNSH